MNSCSWPIIHSSQVTQVAPGSVVSSPDQHAAICGRASQATAGERASLGLRLDTSNVFYYLSSVKDVLRVPFTSCGEHHATKEARCPVLEARCQHFGA